MKTTQLLRKILPVLLLAQLPLLTAASTPAEPPASLDAWVARQPESAHPAFVTWSVLTSYTRAEADPFLQRSVQVACADQELFPLSPSQDTKQYEAAYYARFNHAKLTPRDPLCRIRSAGGLCLSPDSINLILMSDLYRDRCGGVYKAYWGTTFQRSQENMGTLISKGRTFYPKAGTGDGFLEIEEGDTYSVSAADFVLLVAPSTEELRRARVSADRALNSLFRFDRENLLFRRR